MKIVERRGGWTINRRKDEKNVGTNRRFGNDKDGVIGDGETGTNVCSGAGQSMSAVRCGAGSAVCVRVT